MSTIKRSLALAVLLGASLGAANFMPAIPQTVASERRAFTRQAGSSGFLPVVHGYPRGPGWTAAQVKRMAQKRRARAAHKRACKGAR